MLVHEPEAAAVAVVSNLQNPVPLQEHDTLIVIDAGGGTTDITSHKVCCMKPCMKFYIQCARVVQAVELPSQFILFSRLASVLIAM